MDIGLVEWFIVLLVVLGSGVWIGALIDCIIHEPAHGNAKLIWIIVIVFTHLVGAVLYLLLRHPRRTRVVSQ
jgi:phosphotransferase system  glucose/maltose/N-acetylglucosamine-specific IIC component